MSETITEIEQPPVYSHELMATAPGQLHVIRP